MTRLRPALALLLAGAAGCSSVSSSDKSAANPLLAPWSGPFGGVPPLDAVRVEDFRPALEAAMKEQLAEVEAIANDKAAPTFQNTIAALERAGRTFARVRTVYDICGATLSTPEFQAVENEMAPRLAELGDKIVQNEK